MNKRNIPGLLRKAAMALLIASGLVSCADKEDTTPSMADTDRLETLIDNTLPRVKDFRDQYGTYLLYRFDKELDFAYQFEEAANWQNATLEQLDREGASQTVDFLCDQFFNRYTDAFKQKMLPRKVLMVKSLKANTLGLSEPDATGYHTAAANINSLTIAYDKAKVEALSPEAREAYIRQLHATLLASYLINVRAQYPVGDSYLTYSQSYYASLMNEKRLQARQLSDEFFLTRGFFRPQDDESTYFVSAEQDMIQFTQQLLQMTAQMQDSLADYPLMENKLALMANGLRQMGVDVAAINPLTQYYLEMNEASVLPSIVAKEVVTPTNEAEFSFTILRGSRSLARAEVWVNGQQQHVIDLSQEAEAARVTKTVQLTDLTNDNNPVEIRVYEQGRPRPSAVSVIIANHVSKAIYLHIENSLGERYRLHVYNYDYTEGTNDPNVSSIRFRKIPTEVDMNTGIATGGDQRFWIITKENGLVTSIVEKQEVIDYEALINTYEPRHTYTFQYNERNELTNVELDGETLATDFSYTNGLMISCSYAGGKTYHPVYDTSVSPALRLDCLDEQLSGHCFKYKGTEMLNYFYQPDIPAVIPGSVTGIPLQLLYSKYLFTELTGVWNNNWLLQGNTNMTEVTLGNVTWTYNFVLQ